MAVATKRDFSISYGLQTDNTGTSTGNTLFVDQVNDKVGVGTLLPSEKLEVSGNLKISSNGVGASAPSYDLLFYGTSSGGVQKSQAKISSVAYASNTNAGELHFYTQNSLSVLTKRLTIDGVGDVCIGGDDPKAKLDVVGNIRAAGRIDAALYNNTTPGYHYNTIAIPTTNITYTDTGKNLPNNSFRGVCWTGKHYIFQDFTNKTIYFYDSNFDLIEDAFGRSSLTLPGSLSSPHGLTWDGRYLWVIEPDHLDGFDISKSTVERIAHIPISTPNGTTYGIEYADGLFYYVDGSTIFACRWDGGDNATQVLSATPGFGSAFDAQAITYDGSYLWITRNNDKAYKCNLNGDIITTIEVPTTSGLPQEITGWAWNGRNIVAFNYQTGDIYIIHTEKESFFTDQFDINGTGSLKVPVGTTAERSNSPVAGDIRFNTQLVTYEGYNGTEWGGLGGAAEKDTAVATTAATTCEQFDITTHRSATITTQITQGTNYQIGRYLVIHDGTTASIIEQAAVATGDMLGSFSATISGGNLLFQVNMNNSSSATVTSLMTKISV